MRHTSIRHRIAGIAFVVTAAAFGGVGCDQVEEAVNRGGDTPCNEYIAQSAEDKRTTVTKYLENDRGSAPDATTVDAAIGAIDLMCRAQANAGTPIREADISGIIVPK
ncbi:hypothetical protein [Nocardia harenae]|uniref:hypothetical protein n=1 Tax=Nocardia harenae TaxID=358707 RepID=UPI000833E0D2|nr:hypothetical protein [Nocardia harenae]